MTTSTGGGGGNCNGRVAQVCRVLASHCKDTLRSGPKAIASALAVALVPASGILLQQTFKRSHQKAVDSEWTWFLLSQRNIAFFTFLSVPQTLRTKAALSLSRHPRLFALFRPATHTADPLIQKRSRALLCCTHIQTAVCSRYMEDLRATSAVFRKLGLVVPSTIAVTTSLGTIQVRLLQQGYHVVWNKVLGV